MIKFYPAAGVHPRPFRALTCSFEPCIQLIHRIHRINLLLWAEIKIHGYLFVGREIFSRCLNLRLVYVVVVLVFDKICLFFVKFPVQFAKEPFAESAQNAFNEEWQDVVVVAMVSVMMAVVMTVIVVVVFESIAVKVVRSVVWISEVTVVILSAVTSIVEVAELWSELRMARL